MRIIVTGATGFVGQALLERLLEDGHEISAAVRQAVALRAPTHVVGDIDTTTEWRESLEGVDCVVHLAARVHRLNDRIADPLKAYRETNTRGTLRLAQSAADAGAKRFVFLSSAKVLGESSPLGGFNDASTPSQQDPYSVSKWEAEQALHDLCKASGMELCILRPPLVYGPGVRANFLRLLHWVDRGYPLPFGAVRNRRSLIALGNLVDAIAICTTHPAAGETFLVSDGEDLSTPELIRRLATQLQKPARLLNVSPALLRMVGSVTGRSAEIDRLLGDFHVDSTRIRELLTWNPPYSVNQALGETVAWYRDQRTLEKR